MTKFCTDGGSLHDYDETGSCFACGTEKSTPRVLKHRQEAAKQGRKRKEYLVSDAEHTQIRALLVRLRAELAPVDP